MKKEFLFAKRNISKSKGQSISIFILILIAALLMSLWLILSLDYSKNFDNKAKSLNAEDAAYSLNLDSMYIDDINKYLDNNTNVIEYETNEVLSFIANTKFGNGENSTYYVGMNVNDAINKNIGMFEFREKVDSNEYYKVYLPYLWKTGGGYEVNDYIEMEIGATIYKFKVAGFYENMILGSFNSGICSVLFEEDLYNELSSTISKGLYVAVKCEKGTNYSDFGEDLLTALDFEYTMFANAAYEETKVARTLLSTICEAIISVVTIIITIISIVVLIFSLSNQIDEGLKSIGTLKSMGYKSSDITISMFIEYLVIAIPAIFLGVILSYVVLPFVSNLLVSQTGVHWNYGFNFLSSIITIIVLVFIVSIIVLSVSKKLKKLPPIVALREGIKTHNFKKNIAPLDKTHLPLNLGLGIKNTFNNIKQNIAMLIISTFLTLLIVTTSILVQNFLITPDSFLSFVAGEIADGMVRVDNPDEEELINIFESDPNIDKFYRYDSITLRYESKDIEAYVTDDCDDLNGQAACFLGRYPKFDNEVALGGKIAQDTNTKIGDTITLQKGSSSATYIVCGFIQITNYGGEDCTLTSGGLSKITDTTTKTYYFDVSDEIDLNLYIEDFRNLHKDIILDIVNVYEVINGSLGTYTNMVRIIIIVVTILSVLIILFVLYLMIKIFLLRKKKDYGVLKALGYKTSNLVFQTAISFIPFLVIGTAIGGIITPFLFNPVFTVLLRPIGVIKCTFEIPVLLIISSMILFVLLAYIISTALSLRIRKINPVELLTE